MAGRKDKYTVDYFPHYCNGGKTLFVLENKYGLEGYSTWFKTLELLGSSNNHFIDCRNIYTWEFVQAKMRLGSERLIEIYDTLSNLDAIDKKLWENKIIWSGNFVNSVIDAYSRRKVDLLSYDDLCEHLLNLCEHQSDSPAIPSCNNAQRKGKEIKGNEIIYPYQDIVDAWNEIVSSCPEVKKLTDARKEKIRIRLHEISDQPETWVECIKTLFKMVQDSDFLSGRKTSWAASFDWFFVNSKNWIKIAEGNYENRVPANEAKKGVSNQEMRDILQRRAEEIFSQQSEKQLN